MEYEQEQKRYAMNIELQESLNSDFLVGAGLTIYDIALKKGRELEPVEIVDLLTDLNVNQIEKEFKSQVRKELRK